MRTAEPRSEYPVTAVRALAALPVVVYHAYQHTRYGPEAAWPLEGLWHRLVMAAPLGVDLFFMLSGFLLGVPYVRAILARRARSGRGVLIRRAARLLPLYLVTVCLVWALTNPALPGDWLDLLLHLTFTQVYSEEKIFHTNGPAWSLAVEVHFYLLLVLLGALARRGVRPRMSRRGRLALMWGAVAVLVLASQAYKVWAVLLAEVAFHRWPYWFNPLVKLDVFALGLALAVLAGSGWELRGRAARWVARLLGGGLVTATVLTLPEANTLETWWHTLFATGAALLLATVISTAWPAPRSLTWPPLVWVGTISYSLYLWQEPVLRLLSWTALLPEPGSPLAFPITAVVLLVASLLIAGLSYRLIEQTGRQLPARFDAEGRPRNYYPAEEDPPEILPEPRRAAES